MNHSLWSYQIHKTNLQTNLKIDFQVLQNVKSRFQGEFLVMGGAGVYETERCNYVKGEMICTQQEPLLDYYSYYPELLAVPDDYCN